MKLYELVTAGKLNKGDKIYADLDDGSDYLVFDHLDGMYSYSETQKGGVIHLNTAQEISQKSGKFLIE